jgi:hypothetical protein
MVGEFMSSIIPRFCDTLATNKYHNGHPDMLPKGQYPGDAAQHVAEGVGSESVALLEGLAGHNPEDVWLMVFVFASGRPTDEHKGIQPAPFQFLEVLCGRLEKSDWLYAGRSETTAEQ